MKRKIVYDIKKMISEQGRETSRQNELSFALKVGVSVNTVRNWNEDKTRLDLNQLEKILTAYPDMMLEDLLSIEEIEPESEKSTLSPA